MPKRQEAALARVAGQIEDLHHRLADLEGAGGLADLHRAPIGRGKLRQLVGSQA